MQAEGNRRRWSRRSVVIVGAFALMAILATTAAVAAWIATHSYNEQTISAATPGDIDAGTENVDLFAAAAIEDLRPGDYAETCLVVYVTVDSGLPVTMNLFAPTQTGNADLLDNLILGVGRKAGTNEPLGVADCASVGFTAGSNAEGDFPTSLSTLGSDFASGTSMNDNPITTSGRQIYRFRLTLDPDAPFSTASQSATSDFVIGVSE